MNLEQYQRMQAEQARNFRTQIPSVQQDQDNRIKEQSRRGLAAELSGVRGNFSSRGLLYSGLRRGAETDLASNAAAQAAAQRANVNQTLEGQAQSLDNNAIMSGLKIQDDRQKIADQDYDAKMKALQAKQSSLMGLGGALGSLAGGVAGS